ncbi:helical backbone metal receptor [Cohaesibacter intestini]|uniref:helical backbone metal receptor n=1 Tax=Cohaesibacter intestini TaxID=2211145 RepID=UPI0018E596C8|nr:helical backbone metal receptor [Cohaesibacter intestini]
MRVISLVPSWTETLVRCGVDVVGRTRYCIHPTDQLASIPIVGGTKDWDWPAIKALQPDLILLDREENARFMTEQTDFAWHATHVKSIADVTKETRRLAGLLKSPHLDELADRWARIASAPTAAWASVQRLPGLIEWGRKPTGPIDTILYVIWQGPWKAVSRDTFIGSILSAVGLEIPTFEEAYPTINLDSYDPATTLLLFASEPYPFLEKKAILADLPFPHAFVDGEAFCWYGIRALEFLEANQLT